jgi:hypothetical protein
MPYDPAYYQTRKSRFNHYAASQRRRLKAEALAAYGGKCVICGYDKDLRGLCLDHIADDPQEELEYFGNNGRGGDKLYWKLKREGWPQGRFQILCGTCNMIKEAERRETRLLADHGEREHADRILVQARIGKQRNNTSGFKGVFWNSQKGKWNARIMIGYKQHNIGFFVDIADAARAYRAAALGEWGEDANVSTDAEIEEVAARWRDVEMPRPKR